MLIALLQAIVSGLAVGSAYALIALGFSITFTTTKTLNFSHGDFVSVGAFIGVSILWLLLGRPINSPLTGVSIATWQQLVAALGSVIVIGCLGVLLYFVAVRPFAGKPGMSWVMSTIGFGIVLTSLGLAIWGPSQIVVPSPVGDDIIRIAGRREASSALAGLSGSLIAPIASASLYVGLGIALKGFSGAIVGGLSNPRGCVLGGFALGVLESLVNLWQAQWREIVVFLLVILVLALRPYGLLGQHTAEKV